VVDFATLPERTRRFVEQGAAEGERQRGAFDAACQLRDAGATEGEATQLVEAGAARCGLPLPEARAAVKSAFKRMAREPITKRHGSNGDKSTKRQLTATYDYKDETGKVLFQVCRYQWPDPSEPCGYAKTFKQRQPDGTGWTWNMDGVQRVPYGLPQMLKVDEVWIVEGEKDVDTLAAMDITATTNSGGAGKWRNDYNEHFAGKHVIICGDNDQPGRDHVEQVASALHGKAKSVRVVKLPDTVKDISDYVATFTDPGDAAERLSVMADGAEVWRPKPEADIAAKIETALVSTAELVGMELTPREFALRPFLKAGDLGFIYAKRGDGKTWLAMLIAKAIATATNAGPWTAETAWPVLYIDGEMPAEESKRRILALGGAGANLFWIHHEIYFERTGKTLNLADADTQAELTALLLSRGVRVLVLDNLSCLFSGVKENDADSWELVLPWLLQLRRLKIAVIIIAHAGRNGLMRGTSRREDASFWCLKLERNDSDDPQFRGLRFTSLFTKNRNALEDDCPPLEWTIASEADGAATITTKRVSGVELFVSWVRAGLDSATDIAAEMGLSKGQVSKLAQKAKRLGEIVIEDRHYRPTRDA
jgi:5S rRNA maturation endonuclease (ribonuclease M5)/Arc/MetJ family transcription regulator